MLTGYDEENKKKWELHGKVAHIYEEKIELNSVKIRSFNEGGRVDIKADKAVIDKFKKDVSLRDNVVVKESDGACLYTEVLNWKQDKGLIWTDAPLKLVRDENQLEGVGGEFKTDFKKAVIKKNVRVEAVPQTIITSEGPMEVDYTKNIAIFNKDVHVVDRRGEIFCDTLIVFFDPKEKKITRAHAKGNVRIRRGNSWSYCKEAIYDVKEAKVTLLGRPRLEIYPE